MFSLEYLLLIGLQVGMVATVLMHLHRQDRAEKKDKNQASAPSDRYYQRVIIPEEVRWKPENEQSRQN